LKYVGLEGSNIIINDGTVTATGGNANVDSDGDGPLVPSATSLSNNRYEEGGE